MYLDNLITMVRNLEVAWEMVEQYFATTTRICGKSEKVSNGNSKRDRIVDIKIKPCKHDHALTRRNCSISLITVKK